MPCRRNECQVSLTQFSESSGLKLLGRPILADLEARKNAWLLLRLGFWKALQAPWSNRLLEASEGVSS